MDRMKLPLVALAFNAITSGVAGYLIAVGCMTSACGGAIVEAPTAKQQEAVTNETLEEKVCIDTYKTKAQIDTCRAEVKAHYNAKQAALADGGT